MTLDTLKPQTILAPFKSALGDHFSAVCHIARVSIGEIAKDVKSKQGSWKFTSRGMLTSKEGHAVAYPLNNPLWILLRFGSQLTEIANNADCGGVFTINEKTSEVEHCGIEAGIPRLCEDWFQQFAKAQKEKSDKVIA